LRSTVSTGSVDIQHAYICVCREADAPTASAKTCAENAATSAADQGCGSAAIAGEADFLTATATGGS